MAAEGDDDQISNRDLQRATLVRDNSPPARVPRDFFQKLFGFPEFPKHKSRHTAESFTQVQSKFQVTQAGRDSELISLENPGRKYFIGDYQNLTLQVS